MWQQWLRDAHVSGIRINVPAGRRDETVLATLVAALLGYGDAAADAAGATSDDRATTAASREQTIAALGLVERLATLGTQRAASTEEAARRAHAVLSESERAAVVLLARTVSIAPPELPAAARDAHDSLPSFLNRAADYLILDFARRALAEGRIQPAEISTVLSDLARTPGAKSGGWAPIGSDERRVADLVERFWDGLPSRE